MPIQAGEAIWMDGKLVDWPDARIHILTHGLHYGSGVFEGIRAYTTSRGAAVFRLNDHIRRLFRSAHVIRFRSIASPIARRTRTSSKGGRVVLKIIP